MNNEFSTLKVYYGWAKLNKIRNKPAISIVFENSKEARTERGENTLKRLQTTFYERFQTKSEANDGPQQNRIFTEYSMFLYDKKVNGDLDFLLEQNKNADINNVPEIILQEIKNALRKGYKQVYKDLRYATKDYTSKTCN